MQFIKINYECTSVERFFVERIVELVNPKTLDSYRYRLNNPKTLLKELDSVLKDFQAGKIHHYQTVDKVQKELFELMKGNQETFLNFKLLRSNYFIKLLEETKGENYKNLFFAVQILLKDNESYLECLFDTIATEIQEINKKSGLPIADLARLGKMLGFLVTEILEQGFAKSIIKDYIWEIFIKASNSHSFIKAYQTFRNKLQKTEVTFQIVYQLKIPTKITRTLNVQSGKTIKKDEINTLSISKDAQAFSKKLEYNYCLYFEENGIDYFHALNKSKIKLSEILDILYLGHNPKNTDISFCPSALVINVREPQLANIKPVFYEITGSYKGGQEMYALFISKLGKIYANEKIEREAKEKIKSAVRYLRIGDEAIELEQKFVNYWLGLEYLFSNYSKSATFEIILKNFTTAHILVYVKRNFIEFHDDLNRLKIKDIPDYNAENPINYLQKTETYQYIIDNFSVRNPLLAFRANELLRLIDNKQGKLRELIDKHYNNLQWNLARIYRIRNEIVHDAAINSNIEHITTHLRDYLSFVLNNLIDFFTKPYPINKVALSIEDYFTSNDLLYHSLTNEKQYKTTDFLNF